MKKREQHETTPEDTEDAEPFLRRWTRRKADAGAKPGHGERAAPENEAPVSADVETGGSQTERPAETGELDETRVDEGKGDEGKGDEGKGDEDMPSLDSIDEGGGVADFFSPRVSQGLRRAALRRLFAQSTLPVVDDLDDYAGDYTKFTKLGDLVTNEMRHRLEVARQRLARRAKEQLTTDDSASAAGPQPIVTGTTESNDVDDSLSRAEESLPGAKESVSDTEKNDDQEHSEHDRNID